VKREVKREESLKQMEADMKKKHETELKNFDTQVMIEGQREQVEKTERTRK
jgi:hypothetical protein